MDIKKLCEDSHRISKEKGWLEGEKRPFAAIADLIHSELSEVIEEYRNNHAVDEVYYEVKYKEDDGSLTTVTVPESKIEAARKVEGKYGRGRDFFGAKPCGIPIEFADVIIRIAQHCGTEGWDLAGVIEYKESLSRRVLWGQLEEALAFAHLFVSRAFAVYMGMPTLTVSGVSGSNTSNLVLDELANALLVVQDFCSHSRGTGEPRIDLEKAVAIKQAYNCTREHRHGGKKL